MCIHAKPAFFRRMAVEFTTCPQDRSLPHLSPDRYSKTITPMPDGVTESAKAIQEVAKTGRALIETGIGSFLAKVLGEPLEAVAGIVSDKLKFMRAERGLRLYERWTELTHKHGASDHLHPVPPKLALPIIENGTLEENDKLQDLWANLLATASSPRTKDMARGGYIDIIKPLEPVDAEVLKVAYWHYRSQIPPAIADGPHPILDWISPTLCPIEGSAIRADLELSGRTYEISIDNLFRVRCAAPFVESITTRAMSINNGLSNFETRLISAVYGNEKICVTGLGVAFVEACMPETCSPNYRS